jgi:uncharacterized protein (TIGR02284 family)
MANTHGWNPLQSGRAAAFWGGAVAGIAVGSVLWGRRARASTSNQAVGLNKDRIVEVLSGLIAICTDAEEGFETAAAGVKNPEIQKLFREYSRQRRDFRIELDRMARRTGRAPDTSGSFAGTLHHAWMDIKSIVTRGDEGTIIAEAERGEDVAVRAYEEALDAGLPSTIQQVVRRQFADVKAAHDRIRELERSHTSA